MSKSDHPPQRSSTIEVTKIAEGRFVAKALRVVGAEAEGATAEEATQRVRELSLKLLAYKIETGDQTDSQWRSARNRRYALYFGAVQLLATLAIDGLWLGLGLGPAIAKLFLLTVSLSLIFFSERLGAFRGPMPRFHFVDKPTPPLVIAALGWIMLVGIFALDVIRWLR